MTNPLITALASVTAQEAKMEADKLEGYCDGMAGKMQPGRSVAYRRACDDGAADAGMLEFVAEWKRRNATS